MSRSATSRSVLVALTVLAGLGLTAATALAARHHRVGANVNEQEIYRTVDRADYLRALDPPLGISAMDSLDLRGGGQILIGGGLDMNRVDGFSMQALQGLENQGWLPCLRTYEGYGFLSHHWSGAADLFFHPFGRSLTLGGRWADETTIWPWASLPMSTQENFLSLALLGLDFNNYFHRRGASAYVEWCAGLGRGLHVAYQIEQHQPLSSLRSKMGLFPGDRTLRDNPAVADQRWQVLRVRGIWAMGPVWTEWDDETAHAFLADVQASPGHDQGSARFTRIWLEQRGRQKLAPSQFMGYRLAGGFAPLVDDRTGFRLPQEWLFQMGGIGTLRGHDYQAFQGDRMLLGSLEYGISIGGQIRPVLFFDAGRMWGSSGTTAETGLEEGTFGGPFAIDGGLGLQFGSGLKSSRIDFARNLRAKRAPVYVYFRLGLPF